MRSFKKAFKKVTSLKSDIKTVDQAIKAYRERRLLPPPTDDSCISDDHDIYEGIVNKLKKNNVRIIS